jgi:hypothetical protein
MEIWKISHRFHYLTHAATVMCTHLVASGGIKRLIYWSTRTSEGMGKDSKYLRLSKSIQKDSRDCRRRKHIHPGTRDSRSYLKEPNVPLTCACAGGKTPRAWWHCWMPWAGLMCYMCSTFLLSPRYVHNSSKSGSIHVGRQGWERPRGSASGHQIIGIWGTCPIPPFRPMSPRHRLLVKDLHDKTLNLIPLVHHNIIKCRCKT